MNELLFLENCNLFVKQKKNTKKKQYYYEMNFENLTQKFFIK